jgi:hypothetical protein
MITFDVERGEKERRRDCFTTVLFGHRIECGFCITDSCMHFTCKLKLNFFVRMSPFEDGDAEASDERII